MGMSIELCEEKRWLLGFWVGWMGGLFQADGGPVEPGDEDEGDEAEEVH